MAELGTRCTHRKGAGRKLSAYGCARRISTRRAGHVFRGGTRELRRANASPCGTSGVGVPSREVKTPGAERQLAPLTRATCENKRDTKPAERHKGSGKDREHRTTPRWAIGSRSVS